MDRHYYFIPQQQQTTMTSTVATNAKFPELPGYRSYLQANMNGEPLQLQIPQTYIRTTANTAAALTGAVIPDTDVWELADIPVANQTITFSAADYRNKIGRKTVVDKTQASANTTTITLPAGIFWVFPGSTGAQVSATFPATRTCVTFYWTPTGVCITGTVAGWTFA